MKVKEIMVKDVITVNSTDTFYDVIEAFSQKHISGAPVVDGSKVIGIVSESDLMKFVSTRGLIDLIDGENIDIKDKASMKAIDFMTKSVITVKPDDDLKDVIKLMDEKGVNRMPVVEKGSLRGIITRADVVSVISEYITGHPLVKKRAHEEEGPQLETNIDMLLELVKEKGSVKFSDAAKKFNVPESKIEEWGNILEQYDLVKLHYPPIGMPMLKILKEKHGRKNKAQE